VELECSVHRYFGELIVRSDDQRLADAVLCAVVARLAPVSPVSVAASGIFGVRGSVRGRCGGEASGVSALEAVFMQEPTTHQKREPQPVMVLFCLNHHRLQLGHVPRASAKCNTCGENLVKGEEVRACRECDWWLCGRCQLQERMVKAIYPVRSDHSKEHRKLADLLPDLAGHTAMGTDFVKASSIHEELLECVQPARSPTRASFDHIKHNIHEFGGPQPNSADSSSRPSTRKSFEQLKRDVRELESQDVPTDLAELSPEGESSDDVKTKFGNAPPPPTQLSDLALGGDAQLAHSVSNLPAGSLPTSANRIIPAQSSRLGRLESDSVERDSQRPATPQTLVHAGSPPALAPASDNSRE